MIELSSVLTTHCHMPVPSFPIAVQLIEYCSVKDMVVTCLTSVRRAVSKDDEMLVLTSAT
jgi:hypothetical protein